MLARAHEQNDKGQGVETKIVSAVCGGGGAFSPLSHHFTIISHHRLSGETSWAVNESHCQLRPCLTRTHVAPNLCHVKSSGVSISRYGSCGEVGLEKEAEV